MDWNENIFHKLNYKLHTLTSDLSHLDNPISLVSNYRSIFKSQIQIVQGCAKNTTSTSKLIVKITKFHSYFNVTCDNMLYLFFPLPTTSPKKNKIIFLLKLRSWLNEWLTMRIRDGEKIRESSNVYSKKPLLVGRLATRLYYFRIKSEPDFSNNKRISFLDDSTSQIIIFLRKIQSKNKVEENGQSRGQKSTKKILLRWLSNKIWINWFLELFSPTPRWCVRESTTS